MKNLGLLGLLIVDISITKYIISLKEKAISQVLLLRVSSWVITQIVFQASHLVAITSAGGLRGEAMSPAYSATKAYQINYVEALRKKALKNGEHIIVTDIRPGLVDTAMAKGEGLFWVMPVDQVARQIISAIRKKKSKA